MCGLVGVLSGNIDRKVNLETAMRKLRHRGPDDEGVWRDRHIHLGHTRLSILDLSPLGHQPMSYQNGRFWIAFNGEIYNYLELRQELLKIGHKFVSQTDTEVILAAYSEWGISCLEKFRGMFAFGIWDRECKTLFLARDRCGEKPLYYWRDGSGFYFASELKALIALLPAIPDLDPAAVDLYLHYQYVPEPRTPLVGIFKLPAAHYMVINCEDWHSEPKRYWSLEQIQPISGDPVELIRQELERSIELTLRSDVPVGVALSGGIDSGAIAAIAARKYKDTLMAFSVGYPGRPDYDERSQAQQLAKSLGLPFYDVELKTEDFVAFFPDLVAATDDPIADIAAYGHYAVMKLAADQGVKVMLTGIGGDELFWGYSWVVEAVRLTERKQLFLQNPTLPAWTWAGLEQLAHQPFYQRLAHSPKIPSAVRSVLQAALEIGQLDLQHPQQAVYQDLVPDFKSVLHYSSKLYTADFAARIPVKNAYQPFEVNLKEGTDISLVICQLLFETWLVSNCLSLGDRVSMASSVELRMPFLDYKLIEIVMGLRKAQSDYKLERKSWLKTALKELLPAEVINRSKRGFEPPSREWMKAIIYKYIGLLDSGYLIKSNIFKPELIKKIFARQQDVKENFIIFKLLLLEIWYRQLILQESKFL